MNVILVESSVGVVGMLGKWVRKGETTIKSMVIGVDESCMAESRGRAAG